MRMLFVALVILFCSTFALGNSIGAGTQCPDSVCLGATYTINLDNYVGNQLTVDYIIDGRTFTNGTGSVITGHTDGIYSLSLNFSIPITDVKLLSAPGGVNNWAPQTGGQNSSGCTGNGTPYGCAQVTSLANMPVVGAAETMPYVWRFLLTTDGSLLGDQSVKVDFYNYSGDYVNQISLHPVPEASSLLMLGAGLIIGGALIRRRIAA